MCPRKSPLWILLLCAAISGGGGCSTQKAEPPVSASAPAPPDFVALDPEIVNSGKLQWENVQLASVPEVLSVTGRIGTNENRTSRVGAIVDGRVVNVFASAGDRVDKGALLVQIHSHEVHDARAEYAKAIAEMNRRRSELQYARNARDRAARLYELKATSLEQLQRVEADLKGAEYGVTSAQAEINRVEEQLHHLGISAEGALEEYTKVRPPGEFEADELVPVVAPLAGTVLERLISPGMVVTPTTDLLIISDLNVLWVHAEVPEKYLPAIRVGRPVKISVQAYGGTVFPGTVSLIGDTLNPETRTVPVRCQAANREQRLKPEMYATVTFDMGDVRSALLIPGAAVQDINGQSVAFVRDGAAGFRARIIQLGRIVGDRTEVLDGLKPGDTVVTVGGFLLKSELLKRKFAAE